MAIRFKPVKAEIDKKQADRKGNTAIGSGRYPSAILTIIKSCKKFTVLSSMHYNDRNMSLRIIGLDVTRSIAIFLAMSSHVYAEVGLGAYIPEDFALAYRFVSQIAPLIFILLFGTMLEIVYYPRWAAGKKNEVASRLLLRAVQCWVLYAISIFALFLVDDGYSLAFSISCLLFMGNSPYTEILKFYAVALAFAPVLLWARGRIGFAPLIVISLLFQAAWPLLNALPDAHQDLGVHRQIARFIKFFTGFGTPKNAGPSVLHGLTLIVAGQLLGKLIVGHSKKQSAGPTSNDRDYFADRIRMLLLAVTGLAAVMIVFLPVGSIVGMADMSLRMESNVLYFIIGTVFAFLASLIFVWIVDLKTPELKSIWVSFSFFGRTSLFTFSWGNILLYLIEYQPDTQSGIYILSFALVAAICLMSYVFDLIMRKSASARDWLEFVNRPLAKVAQVIFRKFSNP